MFTLLKNIVVAVLFVFSIYIFAFILVRCANAETIYTTDDEVVPRVVVMNELCFHTLSTQTKRSSVPSVMLFDGVKINAEKDSGICMPFNEFLSRIECTPKRIQFNDNNGYQVIVFCNDKK